MSDEAWEEWKQRVRQKPWRDLSDAERKAIWRAQYTDRKPEAHDRHPRAAYPVACKLCYAEREEDIVAGLIVPISADGE